jgi:hypothetical protein
LFRGFNDRVRVMKGYQKGMNIEDLEMNEWTNKWMNK